MSDIARSITFLFIGHLNLFDGVEIEVLKKVRDYVPDQKHGNRYT
jgi:hypothetical protein